jgi:hypothetical protein
MDAMSARISRWRFAYELWSQYGTANVTYRAVHEILRRSGWLGRRFAAVGWAYRPLAAFCAPGVPTGPREYVAFRDQSPARFFFATGRLPRLPPEWSADAIAGGDAVLAGRPPSSGHRSADLGFPFDWLLNPLTGQRVSARDHWCDLDGFEPGYGDLRLLWEAGRFGWTFTLVRAYAATRSPCYAEGFWKLLESWRSVNPPNLGPHWQDGQECALRLLALCFGFYALWGDPSTTHERVGLLAQTIAWHAERVEGNLRFARTQMGNHAVSEAAALYTVGVLFPEFRRSAIWRRKGLRVLDDEAGLHNGPDGSYVQHSMNYHRLMLQDYLWVMRLAELNGDRLGKSTVRKMDSAARFLYLLQDARGGRVPNYGPNDGSLILPLNGCAFSDYRPAVSAMHFLIHKEKLYDDGPWDEDLLWLFGDASRDAPRASPSPARGCVRLDQGGYYVLRGRDTWGMVRCHTFRRRPNQADLLHLDLWWHGLNVLRDSGSYLYNSPGPWDHWFTSTAAHNTVQIAGLDQMVRLRRFTWVYLARSRVRAFRCAANDGLDFFEGEHDGYRRLPGRVTHRRAVLRIGEDFWLVVDDVLGGGRQTIRAYWQMIDAPFTAAPRRVLLDTKEGPVAVVCVPLTGRATLRVARGEEGDRPMGWESLRYGERTPAPAACLELLDEPLPQRIVSLIGLGQDADLDVRGSDGVLRWSDRQGIDHVVALAPPGQDGAPIMREVRIGDRVWIPGPLTEGGRS